MTEPDDATAAQRAPADGTAPADETADETAVAADGAAPGDSSTTAAPPADPKVTVTAFLAALERLDIDAALALGDRDMVYQNVPLRPARGIRAVEKQLRGMQRNCTGFEARVTHIAADGPVVLTERVDVLRFRAVEAEFWVCGTFEVRDGRITLWRDYFDWTTFLMATARGAARAAVRAGTDVLGRRGLPRRDRDQ